jgi:hypothetical protein
MSYLREINCADPSLELVFLAKTNCMGQTLMLILPEHH